MTTAAAIDRLIHHAVILEMAGPSVRAEAAKTAFKEEPPTPASKTPTTTTPTTAEQQSNHLPLGEM